LLVKELLAAGDLLAGASDCSLLAGASGLLVKELLSAGGLLAGTSGVLVEELLAMSCLLLFASSLLINMALAGHRLEAVALVLPHFIDRPLPIPVGVFRASASPM
jgi:hypothetical protein